MLASSAVVPPLTESRLARFYQALDRFDVSFSYDLFCCRPGLLVSIIRNQVKERVRCRSCPMLARLFLEIGGETWQALRRCHSTNLRDKPATGARLSRLDYRYLVLGARKTMAVIQFGGLWVCRYRERATTARLAPS